MSRNTSKAGLNRATVLKAATVLLVTCAYPAMAQDAANPASGAIVAGALVHVQARVLGIEPDTNSVTLQGPRGNIAVIEVNPAVADVRKLHVGDTVNIAYKNAILVQAEKVASTGIRSRIETEAIQPASGGVAASGRWVEILATVQRIDRAHHQITLRGPTRTEVLDVAPEISLDHLKVGDMIRAVFVSAVAASVEPRDSGN